LLLSCSNNQKEDEVTDEIACRVCVVNAPDGTEIPVPAGGIGLCDGDITIRDDAPVQVHPRSANGWYVVLDNTDASNDEASDLFSELTTEGAITTLEHLAAEAFSTVAPIVFRATGLLAGVLVSVFTPSKLTQEVFIRGTLQDDTSITYCLLL
jgi:hypothetical protein